MDPLALFLMLAAFGLLLFRGAGTSPVQSGGGSPGPYTGPYGGGTSTYGSSYGGGSGGVTNALDPGTLDTFTRTIDGEAGNQSAAAQQGVASVVMNRVAMGLRFSSTIAGVCRQPFQFSCWNGGADTNRIESLTEFSSEYQNARTVAEQAMNGTLPDNTGGAVFYFSPPLTAPPRAWGNVVKTVQIDQLSFYRLA